MTLQKLLVVTTAVLAAFAVDRMVGVSRMLIAA